MLLSSLIFCASTGPIYSPATPAISLPQTVQPLKSPTGILTNNSASPMLSKLAPLPKLGLPPRKSFGFSHPYSTPDAFGAGECPAIAIAVHRGYILAIDDRLAAKHALRIDATIRIISTQDPMVSMIREGLLATEEADSIKRQWAARHRFLLKLDSFESLLP